MPIIDHMRDVVAGFYTENHEHYNILFWRHKSGSSHGVAFYWSLVFVKLIQTSQHSDERCYPWFQFFV